MKKQLLWAWGISIVTVGAAWAEMNIVSETFDTYDQSTFEAAWTGTNGLLVPDAGNPLFVEPNDNPPDIQGQGVDIKDGINEYSTPFSILPSATQSIRVSGDFFDDILGNKAASIGLRSSAGANIVELGMWNAETFDPLELDTPADQPVTNFAYRIAQFDLNSLGGGLQRRPSWQYFPLDPVLDVTDPAQSGNPDGLVTSSDIGISWHHYTATIAATSVTLTLDLYRDGLVNTEPTVGVGTESGVDSSVTWQIAPKAAWPFDSLRIGGPSGGSSPNESVIDNISLDWIEVSADNADFDDDGDVDGDDFLTWQRGNGLTDQTNNSNGDADGSTVVDGADLVVWQGQFGIPTVSASVSAVPEPSTTAMMLLVVVGLAMARRPLR